MAVRPPGVTRGTPGPYFWVLFELCWGAGRVVVCAIHGWSSSAPDSFSRPVQSRGSAGRLPDSVRDAPATTHDDAHQALTALLTYGPQKWRELTAVVQAWLDLPEAVRAGIVAMVNAAK